jgi:predicted nucleotide-binding protein (sugar kinase/HSP70/actin superfamily)
MKITFPHLGNTYICVKSILDDIGADYVIPPFNNKKALELGTRYSPEMVCLPLKINIGNYIQAYEMGADTILMAGGCGPCRFGYYSQLHREILRDAGFHMEVIPMEGADIKDLISRICRVVPGKAELMKLPSILLRAVEIAKRTDELEMLAFRTRARECERGATDRIYNGFRIKALETRGTKNILKLLVETETALKSVCLDPNADPLKIGIVGEIYTGIEHFASFDIQYRLGRLGVEVDRKVTVSNWIIEHMIKKPLHLPRDMAFAKAAKPWLGAMIGGHARETVGHTAIYAKNGYDGVIQIFPFSCMPEIVAESLLPSVERDLDIPVLTLIIDEMTGEAGYMTRVEAFIDMLERRREHRAGKRPGNRTYHGEHDNTRRKGSIEALKSG